VEGDHKTRGKHIEAAAAYVAVDRFGPIKSQT